MKSLWVLAHFQEPLRKVVLGNLTVHLDSGAPVSGLPYWPSTGTSPPMASVPGVLCGCHCSQCSRGALWVSLFP